MFLYSVCTLGKKLFFSSQKNVMEFLAPLKPVAIRIVRNAHGNKTGKVWAVPRGLERQMLELEGWGSGTVEVFGGQLLSFLFVVPTSVDVVKVLRTGVCLLSPAAGSLV